jgi:MFS family permease
MVKDLGVPEKEAAFYSGLLVSAYAVAEAMTAMGWGAISDVYGRKPIALIGLAGVALSSIMFGFAKSYWVALAARFIGGALNGNVAIMQVIRQLGGPKRTFTVLTWADYGCRNGHQSRP